jgi:hypothetical protein
MAIQIPPIVAVDSMTLVWVHGAGCIFSHDSDCRDLANTIMQDFGRDLPEAEVNLYGDPIED